MVAMVMLLSGCYGNVAKWLLRCCSVVAMALKAFADVYLAGCYGYCSGCYGFARWLS